jgi:membrane-associated phospholipid phosphatase
MWRLILIVYMFTIGLLLVASLCRKDRQKRREDFLTALVLAVTGAVSQQLLDLFVRLTPHTIDNSLLALDARLGFDTIYWMRAARGHELLMPLLALTYLFLSWMIAIAWVTEQNRVLRRAVVIAWVGCWFFYIAFPAVGPGLYDWTSQTSLEPRDCMPSMHFAWALILAFNARLRWWRNCLWVYAGLVGMSTIATGQHYLVDLIAAVPYALAVQWAAQRSLNPAKAPAIQSRVIPEGISASG